MSDSTTSPLDATAIRPAAEPPRETKRPAERFAPGSLLAHRYRIIAPLGRGGMGEVYRADDIKLGQPVALKFLPASLERDREKLQRLYGEVRIGRQVSHPNVCRLYDVAEWEGSHFISMEYIDGEDLASLLRRIGKLPEDKAVDIAREVCAGIAAAHALGVIHRDLKPANVMLDGRGRARVTDFGLAAFDSDAVAMREIAGTPAYMAPEQLRGGEVTHKTDLYALGLLLYEIFTGKRHERGGSDAATAETRDLEPNVRRVILRCLEEDPKLRPASIQAVMAALPGGDPLQAAIEAGETPSPEMVAAASEAGELRPPIGIPLVIATLVVLLLAAAVSMRTRVLTRIERVKQPEVLADRARGLLAQLGHAEPADAMHALAYDADYFAAKQRPEVAGALPAPLTFVYRESPRELVRRGPTVTQIANDPPFDVPGMRRVVLDATGRLTQLSVIPPRVATGAASGEPEWQPLIVAAELDPFTLRPATPAWSAPVDTDRKFAWTGSYAGRPDLPLRIEAASYRGEPVWFEVIPPWRRPSTTPLRFGLVFELGGVVNVVLIATTLMTAILLARRNLRRGRGDRRGAFVVGAVVFAASAVAQMLFASHRSEIAEEWPLLTNDILGEALFLGCSSWVVYLAVEPYLRRTWPRMLISWQRLRAGRWSDPMLGRDLLVGVAAGAAFYTLNTSSVLLTTVLGLGDEPWRYGVTAALSARYAIGLAAFAIWWSVGAMPILSVLMLITHALLRKRTLALIAVALVITPIIPTAGNHAVIELAISLLLAAGIVFVMTRFGVVAVAALLAVQSILGSVPATLDGGAWYFGRSLAMLVVIAALAVWGFWASLSRQALAGLITLEE